jgi:hypothetical protein
MKNLIPLLLLVVSPLANAATSNCIIFGNYEKNLTVVCDGRQVNSAVIAAFPDFYLKASSAITALESKGYHLVSSSSSRIGDESSGTVLNFTLEK